MLALIATFNDSALPYFFMVNRSLSNGKIDGLMPRDSLPKINPHLFGLIKVFKGFPTKSRPYKSPEKLFKKLSKLTYDAVTRVKEPIDAANVFGL